MWNSSPRARTLAFHSKLRIFIPVFPTLTPPPRKTTYRSLPFPKSYKEEGESAHSFCSRATAHSVFFFFFSSAARYVGADQMRQPNIGEEKKRKDMSDERNAFFSFWSPRWRFECSVFRALANQPSLFGQVSSIYYHQHKDVQRRWERKREGAHVCSRISEGEGERKNGKSVTSMHWVCGHVVTWEYPVVCIVQTELTFCLLKKKARLESVRDLCLRRWGWVRKNGNGMKE